MPGPIDLSAPPLPPPRRTANKPPPRGGFQAQIPRIQEISKQIFWVALVVDALLLTYLLWGLGSGGWSHQALGILSIARRAEQVQNITMVMSGLRISAFVTMASLLVCAATDEVLGYALLGVAALLYLGLPYLTVQWFEMRSYKPSITSQMLMTNFQALAWFFIMPGLALVAIDIARRLGTMAERFAIQKVNIKYGTNVDRQSGTKQKQVFLGRCWEGPFCRENIRVKCPIFLKKKGPCWWHKSGCMCEESIVLQAIIDPNWRGQAAKADTSFNYGKSRALLTPEAKRQRCRDCIIYNEHQRQKHKALTWTTMVAIAALLYANIGHLYNLIASLLIGMDSLTRRFSFSEHSSGLTAVLHCGEYESLTWVIVVALCLILLSQILKVIDYCCYTLKI